MKMPLLTEAEAAQRLAICPRTLRKLRKAGELHYVRIRRAIRYTVEDLDRYVESVRSCTSISAQARPIGGSMQRSTVADFEQARRKRGSVSTLAEAGALA